MGVTGLLENLKGVTQKAHISEFTGKRVAIDGCCWLHRGAIFCSKELAYGEATTRYIAFCLSMIKLLRSEGIDAILVVFDGLALPGKEGTNNKRSADRLTQRQLAWTAEAAGDSKRAQSHFQRSVSITFDMVRDLVEALESAGVHYMVAPYEADAQLAFLSRNNIVDVVITEDSDAIAFGCSNVLYKLDREGNGDLIQREHLPLNQPMSFANWTDDQFLLFCCLAGCDYLHGLRNFGIKSAYKVVSAHKTLSRVLDALSLQPAMQGIDRAAFAVQLQHAVMIYKHQTVYNPYTRCTEPLTPLPSHSTALAAAATLPTSASTAMVGGHVRSEVSRDNSTDSDSEQELSFLGQQLSADITALLVTGRLDPRSLAASTQTEEAAPDMSTPLCAPVATAPLSPEAEDTEPALSGRLWQVEAPNEPTVSKAGPPMPARVVWTSPGDADLIASAADYGDEAIFDTAANPRKRSRSKPAAAGTTCASRAAVTHVAQAFHSDLVSEKLEPLHRRVKPRVGYLQLPRAMGAASTGASAGEWGGHRQQGADGTATGHSILVDTPWNTDHEHGTVGGAYEGGQFFDPQGPPSPVLLAELGRLCEDSTAVTYDTGSYVDDSFHDTANAGVMAMDTAHEPMEGLALFQDEVFYPRFEQKLAVFRQPLQYQYEGRSVTSQSPPLSWGAPAPSGGLARFCCEASDSVPLFTPTATHSFAGDCTVPAQTVWPVPQHALDWTEPAAAAWKPGTPLAYPQYYSQADTMAPERWSAVY